MNGFDRFSSWSPSANLRFVAAILFLIAILTIAYGMRLLLKGPAHSDRVDRQGGSRLLSKGLMEMAYWWLEPLARFFVALGVSANAVSWIALFFGFLAGLSLAFGHFGFGGAFAMVGGLLDAVDGYVARKSGSASGAGALLDSTLDRYFEFFFVGGLVIHYRDLPVIQVVALLALVGSFMVSYSTAKAAEFEVDPPKGPMRRPERMLYLVAGAILSPIAIAEYESLRGYPPKLGIPMVMALALVGVLANVSAIERMIAIVREVRTRERASQARKKNLTEMPTRAERSPKPE